MPLPFSILLRDTMSAVVTAALQTEKASGNKKVDYIAEQLDKYAKEKSKLVGSFATLLKTVIESSQSEKISMLDREPAASHLESAGHIRLVEARAREAAGLSRSKEEQEKIDVLIDQLAKQEDEVEKNFIERYNATKGGDIDDAEVLRFDLTETGEVEFEV